MVNRKQKKQTLNTTLFHIFYVMITLPEKYGKITEDVLLGEDFILRIKLESNGIEKYRKMRMKVLYFF